MPSPLPLLAGQVHSLDAERTALGALLLDPGRIVDVAGVLRPEDFYDPVHRTVYEAIRRLHEDRQPIDFVTVANALKTDEGLAAVGGAAFLAQLSADVPTASHAGHYAQIIRDKALHRRLAEAAARIRALAEDEGLSAAEAL